MNHSEKAAQCWLVTNEFSPAKANAVRIAIGLVAGQRLARITDCVGKLSDVEERAREQVVQLYQGVLIPDGGLQPAA